MPLPSIKIFVWTTLVRAAGVRLRRIFVFVVTLHEVHGAVFVAALRCAIENHQGADELFGASGIARIGVKDIAVLVFIEGAHAGFLAIRWFGWNRSLGEVVGGVATG